jgi:hypothetical protein
MLFKERQDPVIQNICRHQSVLTVIEFGKSDLQVSVNEGLLIDVSDPFERSYIEGALGTKITRMLGLYLTVSLFCCLAFSRMQENSIFEISLQRFFLISSKVIQFTLNLLAILTCRV